MNTMITNMKQNTPVLFYSSALIASLSIFNILGFIIDDRTLVGVNIWIKPLKFSISTAIYMFTIAQLLTIYPYRPRKKKILAGTVAWTLLTEMFIVNLQAYRGVQSHYNMSSLLDGLLFAGMGIFIGINVLLMGIFLVDAIRLKLPVASSVKWSIVFGWLIVIVGSWVGGQMISQMSHTVGAPDGGAGLPLVNWSTIAGDLRIAHFLGIHGIQIIPLFALLIERSLKWNQMSKILLVTSFALLYAGWLGFIFYQAKQGIPLIDMPSPVELLSAKH